MLSGLCTAGHGLAEIHGGGEWVWCCLPSQVFAYMHTYMYRMYHSRLKRARLQVGVTRAADQGRA